MKDIADQEITKLLYEYKEKGDSELKGDGLSVSRKIDREELLKYAQKVWRDVLIPICGAHPDPRDEISFVTAVINPRYPLTEYRFQGDLGFGGKCYFTHHNLHFRVGQLRAGILQIPGGQLRAGCARPLVL